MTKEEAEKKRPCNKCIHYRRCLIVDFIYSPCWITDRNGLDHHGAFKLNEYQEEEENA
jgi:hypothetical protein